MAIDGFRELTPDHLKTVEGLATLNDMLKRLFEQMPGDGETVQILKGYGSPESAVVAGVGAIYQRLDGGASTTIYIKESGTGATGWVAK